MSMRILLLKSLMIFISFGILTGCSSDDSSHTDTEEGDVDSYDESYDESETETYSETYSETDTEPVTFDEIITYSDVAIRCEYVETLTYDSYSEKRFIVHDVLYGDVDDEIYLYAEHGTVNVGDYSYESDAEIYEEGKVYLLVAEQFESVMYDHTRYLISSDLLLCEEDDMYTLYSEPIEIPDGMTMEAYILDLHEQTASPDDSTSTADETEDLEYSSEIEEMVGESDYIGIVTIQQLEIEGEVHNGNTYQCSIVTMLTGDESAMSKNADETILIVILKDTVETGGEYIIGFDQVDDGSIIYTQATETSVYEASDEMIEEITTVLS